MTDSESRFRKELANALPGAYIRKLPDFKQTGNTSAKGLPDYVVFYQGRTLWYEVKMVKSKHTFNLHEINEHQWVTFSHMDTVGVPITVVVYDGNWILHRFEFSYLRCLYNSGIKSIPL